ncbi:MAG: ribonuclease H [Bacteroidetes bacterium]|nr:MAG: ribonuclease H [Bacteroidota bacterium]TAG87159.1 MAG: ribonuclease H [Bacteroidota bacterium]
MPKQKFYVVWKGRKTGIFDNWDECKTQVEGFQDAKYKSFATKTEAEKAFKMPYSSSITQNITDEKKLDKNNHTNNHNTSPILESISVDAACSGNPGLVEYRGVNTATKEIIFSQGNLEDGTNNIGEFLAIVYALAWFEKKQINIPIYSDSMTAISWVKKMEVKTKQERTPKNEPLFNQVDRALQWLKNNTFRVPILKWDTENWGQIPADYGRK